MPKLLNSAPFLIFLLVLIVLYFSLKPASKEKNEIAKLELLSVSGKKLDLKKFSGQAFVLHFFASWCGMCKNDLPFLQQIKRTTSTPVIGIAINDSPERINRLNNQHLPYNFIAFDGDKKAARFLFAKVIPQTIVVNKDSKVVMHYVGAIDMQVMKQILRYLT